MKCFLLSIVFSFTLFSGFSQKPKEGCQYCSLIIDIGPDYTVANADKLNDWAVANNQADPVYGLSGYLTISFLSKHFGGDLKSVFPDPYRIEGIFFGVRMTHYHSRITSLLNAEIGYFDALYNSLRPVNYVLTPDQQGKTLQLQYNNGYIGLSSKTYWTRPHKNHDSTVLGVDLMAGYTPWRGSWSYGSYKPNGKSETFVSQPVYGIPSIDSVFVNVGLFCGIGSR